MKRIIFFFTVILLLFPMFSEPLTGFSGISFGTDRRTVKTELEKQGWWSFYSDSEDKDSYVGLSSKDLNLEGYAIAKMETSFDYNDIFFDVRFYLDSSLSEADFKQLLIKLDNKYGMDYLNNIDGGLYYETDNGNIIMVTLGTQRSLITNATERIFVIEMFDRKLQRNNYNYNHR